MANADAQYVIDISAAMDGGEKTIAELDTLTADLLGAGKNAEFFQQAVKQVSLSLETAASSAAAANDALAAGRATYDDLERSASQANKAVEKLALAEEAASARAAKLAADTQAATAAEAALAEQLAGVTAAIAGAEDYVPPELLGRVDQLTDALAKAEAKTAKLATAAAAAEAAAHGEAQKLLDASVAALAANDALDAHVTVLAGLEGAAKKAAGEEEHFARTLNNVKKLSGHVDKTLARQAESLSKLGGALGAIGGPLGSVGQKLTAPVKGFTELSQVMGGTNAAALLAAVGIAAVAAAIVAAGVAAVYGFGKIAVWATKLADKEGKLADQTERLESNFDELFSGLNIEPVIAGMGILADLFDKNTEAGQAMQFLFESVFQPLIDQAENAAVAIEAFALGFLIGMMKVFLAVKPVIKAIGELFGFEDTSLTSVLSAITSAGEIAAYIFAGLAIAFGAVVLVIGAVVAAFGLMLAGLIAIPIALGEIAGAIFGFFLNAWNKVLEFFGGLDFAAIGANMIQGFINGISSMVGALVSSVTGAVGSAIGAAKSLLGIASPSKVFESFGDMTGEGFVMGVEAQNDNAQAAMTGLVEPPDMPAAPFAGVTSEATGGTPQAPAAVASSSDGGAGVTVNLQGANLTFNGVKDGPASAEVFAEMLTKALKGDAAALGASAAESSAAA